MRINEYTGKPILEISDVGCLEEDANSGTMMLHLIEFDGRKGNELSSSEREPLRVMGAYRRGIIIKKQSYELAFDLTNHPNLLEYDGNYLTVYRSPQGRYGERGNIHEQYRVMFNTTLPMEESPLLKKYRELF